MDSFENKLILLTQKGLPLVEHPYAYLAKELGVSEQIVIDTLKAMLESKKLRRIAAVPNHYRLGYKANGMTVWNIQDDKASFYGQKIGDLPFVSHCYLRPRYLGVWEYNLFAMVHAKTKPQVLEQVDEIIKLLGDDNLSHDVLFSRRILKKTGIRL